MKELTKLKDALANAQWDFKYEQRSGKRMQRRMTVAERDMAKVFENIAKALGQDAVWKLVTGSKLHVEWSGGKFKVKI